MAREKFDYGTEPRLKPGEDRVLAQRLRVPHHPAVMDASRERLITANVGLVYKTFGAYRHRGLDDEDLVGWGMHALCKAADHYSPDLGFNFSTYAVNVIKSTIYRAVYQYGAAIRVPQHFIGRLDTVAKRNHNHQAQADHVRLMTKVPDEALNEDILRSLPAPARETDDPIDHAVLVDRLLAACTPRAADVLRQRYGIGGVEPATLRVVAGRLGVTRERARQIQRNAVEKLARQFANLEV